MTANDPDHGITCRRLMPAIDTPFRGRRPWWLLVVLLLLPALALPARAAESDYARQRAQMVRDIDSIARIAGGSGVPDRLDARVMAVMGEVPRHAFVPETARSLAYVDRPLPIGYGQTISQPYIVALMSHLLAVGPGDTVLEVGTGSGYQAAVLDALGARVRSIEIVKPLAEQAGERLARLGYRRTEVRAGDGYFGWPQAAPFDAIIVTAAAGHVPPPLIEQLRPGGRMIIPVGPAFMLQHLMLVTKTESGEVSSDILLPVRFVPLTGGH